MNPVSTNLLNNLWPAYALTGNGTANNYLGDAPQPGYSHNGLVKIDHNFNEKFRLSLRAFDAYSFQLGSIGDALPYYYAETPVHSQNYNANLNTLVNPHLTNQLLFGSNYFDLKKHDANSSFNPPALGLNTGVTSPNLSGSPFISHQRFRSHRVHAEGRSRHRRQFCYGYDFLHQGSAPIPFWWGVEPGPYRWFLSRRRTRVVYIQRLARPMEEPDRR